MRLPPRCSRCDLGREALRLNKDRYRVAYEKTYDVFWDVLREDKGY